MKRISEAELNLIKAAPSMLVAIKGMAEYLQMGLKNSYTKESDEKAILMLKNLIKLAERVP